MSSSDDKITSLLSEGRVFEPPIEGRDSAAIGSLDAYKAAYKKSMEDPEGYWEKAAEELEWYKRWTTVLDDSKAPFFSLCLC